MRVTVQSPSSNLLSRCGRGLGRGAKRAGGTERLLMRRVRILFRQGKGFTLLKLMVAVVIFAL